MKCILKNLLIVITISLWGCANQTSDKVLKEKKFESNIYVIKNVNVIPMTESNFEVIKNASVVIKGQKIFSINGQTPDNSKVIDGTGKWLLPGLIDMHVHTNADLNFKENSPTQGATFFMDTQDVMTTYIANGVTTIFELGGRVEHFGQRNEVAKGKVIGPRMAIAAMINGGDTNNGGRTVNNSSDAQQAVRSVKAEGYNFIKAYSDLNIEAFQAVVEEAQKQGLKVVGHIPDAFKGTTEEAFVPSFGLVAHAEEFSKQIREQEKTKEDAERFAQLSKNNNTWLIPNLIAIVKIKEQVQSLDSISSMEALKYVHPLLQDKWLNSNNYHKHSSSEFLRYLNDLIVFHKEMVVAFKDAGVPMLAGSDAGVSGVVTGFALHDELELLVDAGLTTAEALTSATRLPAKWLEISEKVGTVEVGKYADLLLLDANPLINIKNTRKINGVFVNGRWVDRGEIDKMLSELADWNTSKKEVYKWKNRREY
ncbi:amidohydrolase family protein [Alteromonas ponticola]|uniref:Amidohydrolase family protein n=1 Tax=Alteromonas ponticola TaxID=2720613 RepID=A0ABX1R1M2_9ALTE|nr:amidohydrolase family protein [Alteromonas ponticola]NMH59506.1 amidohydrolase family protein [Alteromonas ponticola]